MYEYEMIVAAIIPLILTLSALVSNGIGQIIQLLTSLM